MASSFRAVTEFFSSTRLTIILLILLGLASIAGTVIIQKGTSEEQHIPHVYSESTAALFEFLGFFDMYHSGLFSGILTLLALNLVFCTIKRFKKHGVTSQKKMELLTVQQITQMPVNRFFKVDKNTILTIDQIRLMLMDMGFRIHRFSDNAVAAGRGRFAVWGPYICHLGFLIILGGGLVSGLFSVEGMIWLKPSEHSTIVALNDGREAALDSDVECKAFEIERYENGMIKEFRSELIVTAKDGQSTEKTLRVNHPLTIGKYRLYQSSYTVAGLEGIVLQIRPESGPSTEVEIGLNGRKEVSIGDGEVLAIEVVAFEPDFVIGDDGIATSRSDDLRNPAVRLKLTEGSNDPFVQWYFMKMPGFHGSRNTDSFQVQFVDVTPVFATGIQVAYDPGSWLIWAGSVFLIGGLLMSLTIQPVVLRAARENEKSGWVVSVMSPKFSSAADSVMERLEKRLKSGKAEFPAGLEEQKE